MIASSPTLATFACQPCLPASSFLTPPPFSCWKYLWARLNGFHPVCALIFQQRNRVKTQSETWKLRSDEAQLTLGGLTLFAVLHAMVLELHAVAQNGTLPVASSPLCLHPAFRRLSHSDTLLAHLLVFPPPSLYHAQLLSEQKVTLCRNAPCARSTQHSGPSPAFDCLPSAAAHQSLKRQQPHPPGC